MLRQSITDASGQQENCNNLSSNNIHSCLTMSHSNNTGYTTPTRSTLRRYSLADSLHTPSPSRQKKSQSQDHFSTKIDSDSPGYSTRVVQYNEEQEKSVPTTHQCKYDKLGVFPIVHFFKKELPFLKRKVVKVHFPVNSSDLSKFNSPDHNRLLLEKIIRSSPGSQETVSHNSESNTKSVLDALREISGKRIHPDGEEFILKEDGKRMYVDYDCENNLSKRVKQNSQMEDFTRTTSPVRALGLLDELMASRSSMDGCLNEKSKKPRLNGHTSTPLNSFTPAKHVDVETQTSESQIPIVYESIGDSEEANKTDLNLNKTRREVKAKKVSPVKVFDETPLEIMRKNRLTALMGSLTANREHNKTETSAQQDEDKSVSDKPLISILAGSTKNLHKSVKHVTFDIPDVANSTDVQNNTNNLLTSRAETNVTKTSVAISSPIVSAIITESISPHKLSGGTVNDLPSLPKNIVASINQKPKNANSEVHFCTPLLSTPVISDGMVTSPSTQSQSLVFTTESVAKDVSEKNYINAQSTSSVSEDVEVKTSEAMIHNNSAATVNMAQFPAVSVNQGAGFKFELKETTDTRTSTTLTVPTTSRNATSIIPPKQGISNIFGDTNINQSFSIPSVGPFSINNDQNSSTSSNVGASSVSLNTFGQSATTSQPTNNTFNTNFSMKSSAPNFNNYSSSTNKPTSFTFGLTSQPITTTAPNFTSSTFNSGNSSSKLFDSTIVAQNPLTVSNTTTPISLSFNVQAGARSTTSPFSSSSKGFVTSNPSTSSVFPKNTTKPSETNNFFFSGSDNSFTKKSAFNNENSTSSFGTIRNSKAMFGQVSTTLFGTTTTSRFGSNSGNTVGLNAFENVKTTTNSVFATTNSFATSKNSPAFSANTNSNFAPINFGINQNSNLGGNLNTDFKPNDTPQFGSPFNNTFGGCTNTSGFTTSVSTVNAAPTNFDSSRGFGQTNGIASVSSFGASSSFKESVGPNSTETTPYGNTNPQFGSTKFSTNPQDSQNNVFTFGTNKPPVFSFGTNEPVKSPFSFQTETNANIFGNKDLTGNAPSTFNALTSAQFNVQPAPAGGNMFNIGVGSATPNRMRTQHKAKRRT